MKTALVGFASSSPGQANNGEHCSYLGLETKFLSSFYMVTSGGRLSRGRSTTARISRRFRCPPRKLYTTIKSSTTKGGGGSNELRFEDRKGAEEIYLHGQRDWRTVVEHDRYESIGNSKTVAVAGNQSETIGKAHTLAIGGAYQVTVGGAMDERVGSDKETTVGGALSKAVGRDLTLAIGNDASLQIGRSFSLTAGNGINVVAQRALTITSDDQITFKCGQASVVLKKNGDISITGSEVSIKASGDIVLKGQKIIQN